MGRGALRLERLERWRDVVCAEQDGRNFAQLLAAKRVFIVIDMLRTVEGSGRRSGSLVLWMAR